MRLRPPFGWRCAGISVGRCVGDSAFAPRHAAHAHNHPRFRHFGWICVRHVQDVGAVSIEWVPGSRWDGTVRLPSETLWHERAHIETPTHGHDAAWRATMRRFNQPLPAQYERSVDERLQDAASGPTSRMSRHITLARALRRQAEVERIINRRTA